MASNGVYKQVGNKGITWQWKADGGRDEHGKRIWETGTARTEKEAREARAKAMDRLRSGLQPTAKQTKMSLASWLRRWIKEKPNLSPKSRYRYEEVVEKHLIPALGRIELSKLRPSQIQNYYKTALESGRRVGDKGGLAHSTIEYHHHVLSSALRDAVEDEEIRFASNPAAKCKLNKSRNGELSVLSAEQARQLFAATQGSVWHVPIVLAVCTGCRRGELAGLRWSDVNLDKGTVRIVRSLGQVGKELVWGPPKTEAGRRTLVLPKLAVDVLITHRKAQEERKKKLGPAYQDDDLICSQNDGKPVKPDSISHNFHRALDKAKLQRIRFHDLRDTAATLLLEEGASIKAVQGRLGHADARTTLNIYAHFTAHMQQDAADRLDNALGSPSSQTGEDGVGSNGSKSDHPLS